VNISRQSVSEPQAGIIRSSLIASGLFLLAAVVLVWLEIRRRRRASAFAAVFADRVEAPMPVPPAPIRVDVSAEEHRSDKRSSRPDLSIALGIDYVDAAGAFTRRRLSLTNLDREYLEAWCHERRAYRTFRRDRVHQLWDARTGEILTSFSELEERVEAHRQMLSAARDAEQRMHRAQAEARAKDAEHGRQVAANERLLAEAWRRCGEGAVVLIFLARSDGALHHAEATIIRQYLDARCGRYKSLAAMSADLRDRLRHRVMELWPNPDRATAAIAVLTAERQGAHRRQVAELAMALIEADGVVHNAEKDFAAGLSGWLGRSARARSKPQ